MNIPSPAGRAVTPMLGDATPFECSGSMGEVLQRVAAERPEHDALRWIGGRMSQREFNARTNAIAADLIRHGVKPGEIVGVSFGRSAEFVMLIAGIIKAGAAYMPLDENLPEDRLRTLLEQALPWHVLAPPGTKLGWARLFCNVWEIDAAFFGQKLDVLELPKASGESLAYILFTSGSTGAPKGVEVVQRGIQALVFGGRLCEFDADEVFLHHSALSFDASTLEIWGALLSGATLAVYTEPYPSVERLQALLAECHVTSAIITATYFNVLADTAPGTFLNLRRIDVVGEAVSVPHVVKAQRHCPRLVLFNGYGPTECTVYSVTYRIPSELDPGVGEVPIGRMLPHWFGHVLDETGAPAAQGAVGELHIGGAGLARGYLPSSHAPQDSFYHHESLPGRPQLYRTGDLVRVGGDGLIYFCGRADTQVKLRGFRIELGEIERRLCLHPAIRQAVAAVRDAGQGDRQLLAFFVSSQVVTAGELRAFLEDSLPQHMVPSRFVALETIPLLASGKCDRKSLLAMGGADGGGPAESPTVSPKQTEPDLAALWRRTQRAFPETEPVPVVFARVVLAHGSKTALVDGAHRLTYAELDRLSDCLAGDLAALGVRTGSAVGLSVPRSAEFVVGALAVMKCGAAYVPLDPASPSARLAEIVADAGLKTTLVLSGSRMPGAEMAGVIPFSIQPLAEGVHPPAPVVEARGGSPAYIMYTSGSTGRPKGVVVAHKGILRLSFGQPHLRCSLGLRTAFASSVVFDASVSEIWPTLLNGGELHVFRESVADTSALRAFLQASKVEILQLTTALFHLIVDENPACLAGPRLIASGGEALSPSHCAKFYRSLPGSQIVNTYGPTETTVDSHAFWVPHRADPRWMSVPIGYPVANTLALVCDDGMRIVPAGTEGSLWLGGPGLAIGYLNLPSLTAEAFPSNPFPIQGVDRLYRTGDRVVQHADGSLEFRGRQDNQVKLRGFRVELGEVETALGALEGVARAVAAVRNSPSGQPKLVGYVVMREGSSFSEAGLLTALGAALAPFMVPSHLLELTRLPLNSNGKVNRQALPSPLWTGEDTDVGVSNDPVRKAILDVWSEVLGGFPGNSSTSFFEAGGDSLDASRALVRLRQRHGMSLSLSEFMANPTLGALCDLLGPRLAAVASSGAAKWVRSQHYPPSSFQRRQLLEWIVDPSGGSGNLSHHVALPDAVDESRLRSAFESVLARHEILRTRYDIAGDEMTAWVDPSMPVDFRAVHHAPGASGGEVLELLRAEASVAFNLKEGPIARMSIHRIAGKGVWMHLMTHHIALDGWSLPVLIADLLAFYKGSPPSGEVAPYSSFAAWERAQDAEKAGSMEFWRKSLHGLNPLLPFRPIGAAGGPATVVRRVVWPTGSGLGSAATLLKTTPLNLLSVALQLCIRSWLRADDFALGTAMAVRPTVFTESMVGFFVNPVLLRCTVPEGGSIAKFVADSHTALYEALSHADVPFEEVVTRSGLVRPTGADGWLDVMLVLQSNEPAYWEEAGRRFPLVEIPPPSTPFSIVLSVTETEGQTEIVGSVRTDRVALGDFDALLQAWQSVLAEIARPGPRNLDDLLSGLSCWPSARLEARLELRLEKVRGVAAAVAVAGPGPEANVLLVVDGPDRSGVRQSIGQIALDEACALTPHFLPCPASGPPRPGRREALALIATSSAPVPVPGKDVAWLPLYQQLQGIWEDLLGVPCKGVQQDFFDLGGHSLLALRLVKRIQESFGVTLTIETLFKARTIMTLGQVILRGSAVDAEAPMLLQKGSGSGQLFFFHGDLSGGGLYCRDLFKGILPEWDVWLIHPPPPEVLLHGVPALAEYHLARLRPVLGTGPLLLGGFCLSGWAAYEIAARLAHGGATVDGVFLIDTVRPELGDRVLRHLLALRMRTGRFSQARALDAFRRHQARLNRARRWWLRNKADSPLQWIKRAAAILFRRSPPQTKSPDRPPSADREPVYTLEMEGATAAASLLWSAAVYLPPKVAFKVSLALSFQPGLTTPAWRSGWRRAGCQPQAVIIEGTHLGIITRTKEPLRSWLTRVAVATPVPQPPSPHSKQSA